MVKPSQRKVIARWAVQDKSVSIVLACTTFGISETCYRYRPMRSDENEEIADWLLRLTACHKRWGFGLCFLYLRNVKGFGWNHKRVYRIYRELELNLRIKPRRRLKREKPEPLAVPERPNDTWSMDFMADQLTNGRSFRTFNVLDDFSREGLGIEVWMYRFHQNALRGLWIGLSNGAANPERFVVITDRKISVPRFVAGQRSEVSSSITFNQENHNRMLI